MKTIQEIVHFFNDHQVFITTENQPIFTYSDLKKQIDWTKNFLHNKETKFGIINNKSILVKFVPLTEVLWRRLEFVKFQKDQLYQDPL